MAQNEQTTQDPDLQLIAAHEAFANDVKKAMKSSKEQQSIKSFIPFLDTIDPVARDKDFRDSKPKRGPLSELAIFMTNYFSLKSKPSSTTIKAMNAQELIAFVLKSTNVASPSSCNFCNSIFNINAKADYKCFSCGTDLCHNCITEDEVNKVKSIINHAVVICGDCDETSDTTEEAVIEILTQDSKEQATSSEVIESEKEKNTSESSQSSGDKDVSEEAVDEEGEFTLVKVYKNKKNKKNKIDTTEDTSDKEDTKICSFYVQFRCKHGTWGKNCNFAHPKLCREYMKKGETGCNLKDNCDYLHPKMCGKSLKGVNCNSLKCHLGHIRGTRDLKEAPIKKEVKEATKDSIIPKQDFRKEQVKNSKMIQVSQSTTPTPVTPSPEAAGMETLLKSITALQEQMTMIQKDREMGREDIKNLWSLIQTKTIHQDQSPPISSKSPPPAVIQPVSDRIPEGARQPGLLQTIPAISISGTSTAETHEEDSLQHVIYAENVTNTQTSKKSDQSHLEIAPKRALRSNNVENVFSEVNPEQPQKETSPQVSELISNLNVSNVDNNFTAKNPQASHEKYSQKKN